MDPLSILSATGTAIGITKNVAETLSTLIARTQNADRSLEQLYREVTDFEGVLQRMNYDFSDQQMRAAAFETQTGNIGAHWNAVLQAILKCNERLEELEKLLKRLAGNSSVTSNKIVKGFRLNFATSDIHFFQSEIEAYKKNITLSLSMILVCRVMDPRMVTITTQPDLVATENEIRRLRKEIQDIKASASIPEHNSVQRKPVQSPSTTIANQTKIRDETQPILDANTIRNFHLETARILEPTLEYASALVSTASTYTGQRLSIEDEVRKQRWQSNPAIFEYIEDHEAQSKRNTIVTESPVKTVSLLLPRFVASLLLFAGLLLAIGLGFVVMFFWFLVQISTGFTRWGNDSARMKRDGRVTFDWFEERWRDIW